MPVRAWQVERDETLYDIDMDVLGMVANLRDSSAALKCRCRRFSKWLSQRSVVLITHCVLPSHLMVEAPDDSGEVTAEGMRRCLPPWDRTQPPPPKRPKVCIALARPCSLGS
jgi:hypothetical protein